MSRSISYATSVISGISIISMAAMTMCMLNLPCDMGIYLTVCPVEKCFSGCG